MLQERDKQIRWEGGEIDGEVAGRHRPQEAGGVKEQESGSDGGRKRKKKRDKRRVRRRGEVGIKAFLPCQYSQRASSTPHLTAAEMER